MNFLERLNQYLDLIMRWGGAFFVVAMLAITVADIVLRGVWVPIWGSVELMGFFGAMSTALALGYTQRKRMHIAVDILVTSFSAPVRRALNLLNYAMCTVFFGLCAWQIAKWSTTLVLTGELTETLRMAYYPFTYATALGCAVLALVNFTDFLKALSPQEEASK